MEVHFCFAKLNECLKILCSYFFGESLQLLVNKVSFFVSKNISIILLQVSTFSRAHKLAMARGFAPDIGTSLLISGLWTASFHLGNFVGPTASGFMVEAWGFR